MTIEELTLGAMTAAQGAEALVEHADEIDGTPQDETEALVEKLAATAKADGSKVEDIAIPTDRRFTDREKALTTPAVIERAERLLQKQAKGEKPAGKTAPKAAIPTLPYNVKRDAKDRWWVVGMAGRKETGEEHGPYVTKKEATAKRKELLAAAKSEPTQAEAGHPDEAEIESTATPSKSEQDMATKTKKKTKAPKQPKAKKVKAAADNGKPKKLSQLTAAYEVLKGRTKPMSAKEIVALLAERKLWESPGGKTPDATLAAAIVREIATKGAESRFTKPEPGRFLAQ